MTAVYTDDTLKSLTKPHFFDLIIKMQVHTNSTKSKWTDGIRNLNANFKRRESDVEVCKKLSDALVKQVASAERQRWKQIIYISNLIVHSNLSKTVCKVLQHIGADICEKKIESCHPLQI